MMASRAPGLLLPGAALLPRNAGCSSGIRPVTSLQPNRWPKYEVGIGSSNERLRWVGQRRGINGLAQGFSFVEGPSEPPLLLDTIPSHFASIVSAHGDRPAVTARAPFLSGTTLLSLSADGPATTTLTYAALDALSTRLADALSSAPFSMRKGDRLAVSLGNGVEFAALTYAAFKLGVVLVPLNPAFTPPQVAAALRHLGVEVLVMGAVTDLAYRPGKGRGNEALMAGLLDHKKADATVPSLKQIIVVDNTAQHESVVAPFEKWPLLSTNAGRSALVSYTDIVSSFSSAGPLRTVRPSSPLVASDVINIQFTSGTTSLPKAAQLTHRAILNNGYLIGRRMGLRPGLDRIVVPPPLFHCFGCVLGYMACATSGAAILFPSPAFDPVATLRMVADHKAHGLYGVSTMFVAYLEALAADPSLRRTRDGGDGFAGLRTGIVAGSTVPESLMGRVRRELGDGVLDELVICYGQTETAPVSTMTLPHDDAGLRLGTVGVAMPHTAVKIVHPADRSRVLRVGEKGELAAAGYLVMEGYWNDEERTKVDRVTECDDAGEGEASGTGKHRTWMYSGDEASMDAHGYVRITGRIKDLIIRGGENIHPLEVEDALFKHPLVAEVSVVGVPDDRHGECVAAFVVPHKGVHLAEEGEGASGVEKVLTKQDVREWVRNHLSNHLVPKYVFWIDEYPKTASGKIQKYKLREMAKEMVYGKGKG